MKKLHRISSVVEIRNLANSTCSFTWGSGSRMARNRRYLGSPSPRHKGDPIFVFYCTETDWKRAFKKGKT